MQPTLLQLARSNPSKINYVQYLLEGVNDEWKHIYTSTLSRTSLQSIAKHSIGETLTGRLLHTVAQNVRKDICEIVAEAAKNAKRTRSPKIKMQHLLFALEEHNINLDLLHLNYAWPVQYETDGPPIKPLILKPILDMKPAKWQIKRKGMHPVPRKEECCALADPRQLWQKREQVLLMTNKKFPLSMEQQEFYVLITQTCMGTCETSRREALQSLSTDSSLQRMLPKISAFISEAVKVNMVQHNFALLLYLMRMVHSLLTNPHLQLHNYLHILMPSVISCAVGRQLCPFPVAQNHWSLREYAAIILAEFVKMYATANNDIMTRVINIYKKGLKSNIFPTVFGCLVGLSKMGKYIIRSCIIPEIRYLSDLIEPYLIKTAFNIEQNQSATYIKHKLLRISAPFLKLIHNPLDSMEDYSEKYGILGKSLYAAILLHSIMNNVFQEFDAQMISDLIAEMEV